MTESVRLSQDEIADITGVERGHPRAQLNRLRRMGIKAELNARREVVCFPVWVQMAALPPELLKDYIPKPSSNDDDDIGMNLGALSGPHKKEG